MAPTLSAAYAANTKAVMRLKTACSNLECLLPPPDNMEVDESTLSEAPTIKPRSRLASMAHCAQCKIDIVNLLAGNGAGHGCTHPKPEACGEEDADDEVSVAGSDTGQTRGSRTRGGKKKQANAGVVREYMDKMD